MEPASRSLPVVHVISDALGDTACDVVLAAAGQFEEGSIRISRLSHVSTPSQVESYLDSHVVDGVPCAAYFTIVGRELRAEVAGILERRSIPAVDLMGPAIAVLTHLTGQGPKEIPGVIHLTDERYFNRIECLEYVIEHDDGRGADDLADADMVLIGVSRTSKTPLSMYLAFRGYRVANIPLAHGLEPPASLFDIDPARIFGLLSTTSVIADIRNRRLGDDFARSVAASYSDPAAISCEMEEAHALMRRLGCFIVRTDGKAIEESAVEIERHFLKVMHARAERHGARA